MSKYTISKLPNEIHVFGEDQSFDTEDCRSLWNEHKIYYRPGSIIALYVEDRKYSAPLVHIMHEDDGHLFWDREHCVCFDAAWLDSYIDTMSGLKKLLRRCE